ncbi:hypothetical protein EBH_0053440 [Eimeria brunetti]|uniref:Uncharacterized protein n=1 Tax=Eimeria brunetti TaxID=51314 RepID=U6LYR2_9EIME|nr:hypothetical protein EBH_0053440 [Eimeria brunetti]
MVSQCFFLSRQQQKQVLQLQSVRRLAAEREAGKEKGDGRDGYYLEHICEEERKESEDIQEQVTTSSTTYMGSDRLLEFSPFEEGKEIEDIKVDDADDDEPPKKKKKEEMELQKEEGSFSLTPSFAVEMYAPASPTAAAAAAAGAAGGGAAAESIRESILQYVEEILADDNGGSEAVEEDIYFSSLLYELNMMVGTQSIDEIQHQQHILQQQQQRERKQQALIDQFSNAVHSVVAAPAYGLNNNRDYDDATGEETGEEREGDDGIGKSGGEGDKNDVTAGNDNDDNDGNAHTDHSDDTNDDNSDDNYAGGEGAADDENDAVGDNGDANKDDNNGDGANDGEADTGDDNGYADAEDNAAAAAVDDNIGDDTEDVNDEHDDVIDTADEGTSAAAFAAATAVPADYGNSLEGALVVQRQQQRRKGSSSSESSKGQTLYFSSQERSSYSTYQVAIIVDPPGRLSARVQEEMRKRRRRKGKGEQHFQKQFIFTAGKPSTYWAYTVVCKEINYQGKPSLLLYWMPFVDSAVASNEQQRQRQQQQQQQNLGNHPFFRLPSVSPSASVRSFTRRYWTPRQKSTLRTALLMTDAMFAAAEVLGEKAKKNEWWKDVIGALPVYRRPTVVAAAGHASQQSLMLVQLLQSALEAYKGGQRPPPLVLVPLKQILLCTHAVPGLIRGNWTRLQRDDQEWQLEQVKQQQENLQQQQAQQLQAQHEGRQQVQEQVQQQVQEVQQEAQEPAQEAQQQQPRQQAEAGSRKAAAGAAASAAASTESAT